MLSMAVWLRLGFERKVIHYLATEVPMLNALDCWMSFCILLLVAGTALYVEPVSKGPQPASAC